MMGSMMDKLALKKQIIEELMSHLDGAEAMDKLSPKPKVGMLEIEAKGMGDDSSPDSPDDMEEKNEPMSEKMNEMAGIKKEGMPGDEEMSDDDLKKLLAEYMG